MRRTVCLLIVSLLLQFLWPTPAAEASAATATPVPAVMASTGDSITRAFNVGWCCAFQDSPARSWSTGTSSTVLSHYRRLVAFDPQISGHAYNNALSGARMSDLERQMRLSASQGADYVTVEMGANDLCRSSIANMTPTSTFKGQFRAALTAFVEARPDAHVLVASIPNLYQLWQLFRYDPMARFVWSTFGICRSMLSASNTEAMRLQVAAREHELNNALRDVCAEFVAQCRWDGFAVFNTAFTRSDVSTVDYFHPSTTGQNRLSTVTWATGYWSDS